MNTWTWGALGAVVIGLLVLLVWTQSKRREAPAKRAHKRQQVHALDTVAAWEPHATRILSTDEREAHSILTRALPDHLVLAQVPLSRFLRVPTRYSYSEWLKRVGTLSADLVVCDRTSAVVAVVEVHSARESERSRHRQERMARVLGAAHIRLLVWTEGHLPSVAAARAQLLPDDTQGAPAETSAPGLLAQRPLAPTRLSAMPVADVEDSGPGGLHEPPPSTWFDELDQPPTRPQPLRH